MKRKLTPQEKKRHSLAKDHPLQAEAPKAFRRKRPRSKRIAQKQLRARIRDHLSALKGAVDPQVMETADTTRFRRKFVRKWGSLSLSEVIARKAERRERSRGRKNRSSLGRVLYPLLREAIPDLQRFTVFSEDRCPQGEVHAVVGYLTDGAEKARWATVRMEARPGRFRLLAMDPLLLDGHPVPYAP